MTNANIDRFGTLLAETTMTNEIKTAEADIEQMDSVTIGTLAEDEPLALYEHYQGQSEPQIAYIEINPETETLGAGVDGEIGNAVPMDVWHGRRLQIGMSRPMLPGPTNALMAEIAPLAQRVCDGYSCEWDGNNMVGDLDEDASAAYDEIESLVEQASEDDDNCVTVWDAGDWLDASGVDAVTAATTDEELETIADDLRADAESEGVHYLRGLDGYLEGLRDAAKTEAFESGWEVLVDDGNGEWAKLDGHYESASDALEAAVDELDLDCWRNDGTESTIWIDVGVRCTALDLDDERRSIAIDPEEPDCPEGDHDWQAPEWLGGCKENPGCWGSGGGVRYVVVCAHCGAYKHVDTWAQRRDTGEQGLASVRYELSDKRSEEWICGAAQEAEEV